MIQFKQLALEQVKWDELDCYWDRNVYQTRPWLNFLENTQHAKPVVAAIDYMGKTIGHFTGLIVNKYGVKILGSPFRGWISYYMGFNLLPEYPRREVFKALPSFIFDQLKCHYFEIRDRYITEEDYADLGYSVLNLRSFEIDLTKSEEELYASMNKSCRKSIRKAKKNGVYIEEAQDIGFVDDYYDQLLDVYSKQSMVPFYPKSWAQEIINQLLPTGNLLLLRARNKDGLCIATIIDIAFNDMAIGWGGTSWREYQKLRPNELLQWYSIRYWKARGMKRFDMGGTDKPEYKRKYGGYSITVPRLMMSKYESLFKLRDLAIEMVSARRRILGYLKR